MKMKRLTPNLVNQYLLQLLILSNLMCLVRLNVLINNDHKDDQLLQQDLLSNKRFQDDKDVCHHNCEMNEIPIQIAEQINEVTSVDDYLHNFVDESASANLTNLVRTRRAPVNKPKPANCLPIPTVINLRPPEDKDPTTIYFPQCTVVNRCSGCCTHKLLACHPVEHDDIEYTISKSQYVVGSPKLKNLGNVLIKVPEHKKCKCLCSITEKDCNSLQKYEKSNCKCTCINDSAREDCRNNNDIKLWDESSCTCACRKYKDCSTGTEFDHNSCSCKEIPDFDESQAHLDTNDYVFHY